MSIFSQQLRFEPLTAQRRKELHSELIALSSVIVLVTLAILWQTHRLEINSFFGTIFDPITHPLSAFVIQYFLAPLVGLLKHAHPDPVMLKAIANTFKFIGSGISGLLCYVLLPLTPIAFLVGIHSGFLGFKQSKNASVLSEEWRKWFVLHFEPRVYIPLEQPSVWKELVGAFLLFLAAYVTLFFAFSGALAAAIPSLVVQMTDRGVTNWLIASLRDAHFHVPHQWETYLSLQNHQAQLIHADNPWQVLFRDAPELRVYAMPAGLVKYRLFVAAFVSLFGAIPFTLSMIAAGLDNISSNSLKLTPTRITKVQRCLYFFWHIQSWRWSQLASVGKESTSSDEYILSFANCKPRQLKVNVAALTATNQKLFLQALAELAVCCEFSKEVSDELAAPNAEAPKGYTLFWEDALRSKRKSTVFVPLAEGALLNDGRIKIVRQLAGQGWAATYLARKGDELVVVRESHMSNETEAARRAAAMLQRESVVLSALKHDGIATVLDHFVENERSYLTLEYVAGRDLRQHIELAGAMSESATLEIALKLCDILEYLHSQDPQIIHRDISPDNLIRTESKQLKLIDFGACKQFVENATGTIVGKQVFMAPEQLRGKAVAQSDIYSLGATLHYLLTAIDPIALTECHPRASNETVSQELDGLIAALTNFEQSQRPSSITQVRDKLTAIKAQADDIGMFVKLTHKFNSIRLKTAEKVPAGESL